MADSGCSVDGLFLSIAGRYPEAPAIRCVSGKDVTYRELAARTDRIAAMLQRRGVGPGKVVALQNAKTRDGYAAMLACLRLGAPYTNLDLESPPARLSRILGVCQPALVLCDETPAQAVLDAAASSAVPLATAVEANEPGDAGVASQARDCDIAYIMFTSGSTGTPKGVAISQASVANFIAWSRSVFRAGPGDVVANANQLHFDNSVFDFYSALFTGACLAPITASLLKSAVETVRRVDAAGCTIWFSVPSLLIYLMTMKALSPTTFRRVRAIIFGGEGYPKSELAKLLALYGGRSRLYNVYGPTECTCICSAFEIDDDVLADRTRLSPLGRIADNFSYVLLDGDREIRPGEPGELCLMGPQLALGYYNDPERTRAVFVQNPLSATPQTMYRTGDLVREEAGLLHFVGRIDNQVKHMGYRIELEEVEVAINGLAYVAQSAVVYKRIREGYGHLIAYVATGNNHTQVRQLRDDLKLALPPYMIPNRFVILRELPKNANGKIDRTLLKGL